MKSVINNWHRNEIFAEKKHPIFVYYFILLSSVDLLSFSLPGCFTSFQDMLFFDTDIFRVFFFTKLLDEFLEEYNLILSIL